MIADHDVHVHTTLSACCHDPQATASAMLTRAEACGLRLIGFADHLWDRSSPGASAWYAPQDMDHVLSLREGFDAAAHGVDVLFGCESEYCGAGKVGVSPAAAGQFDFVLLPMSHLHMKDFVIDAALQDSAQVGALMVERFLQTVSLGIATGIAHPFLPLGFREQAEEIIGTIPDAQFRACFAEAARQQVSIEITLGFFPSLADDADPPWPDETFLRVLDLARREGCVFHCASDTHSLAGVGDVKKLEPIVQELGLTHQDIHPLFRRV